MKQVSYRKHDLARYRGRAISVGETVAENDCDSRVVKNFIYLVTRVDALPAALPAPQIRMMKRVDTTAQQEHFVFKVKGVIYIKKNRFIFQIRYCHSLNILMSWKTQLLSSQKPSVAA